MKNSILVLSLYLLVSGSALQASPAHGVHGHHGHGHPGHVHRGFVGGIYFGYGFSPIWVTPYGYSYWPYFRFLPRYATYGAISVSPSTRKFGVAWGNRSRRSAFYEANGYCGEKDCKPAVWVQGGCAAIAASEKGKGFGWGVHTTRHQARTYAMRGCKKSGAEDCKAVAWVCSN